MCTGSGARANSTRALRRLNIGEVDGRELFLLPRLRPLSYLCSHWEQPVAARRIWRDVANVVWYYITHLQAEINNRAVYIYIFAVLGQLLGSHRA